MITHTDLSRFVYETGSPFRRLEHLLADIKPNPELAPITMTVGAPRHDPPDGVMDALSDASAGFHVYPAINGTQPHRTAIASWLERRYGLTADHIDRDQQILPLNGSREGLTFSAACARQVCKKDRAKSDPLIIMQNPFYQAYAAAALTAGAEIWLLEGDETAPPALPDAVLERTIAAYIASPTNPQGRVLSASDWEAWIDLARTHDFMLLADECYSEIYSETPPPGALEVALKKTSSAAKVVSFNSLSKRSNLPGLRSGFAAGCEVFIQASIKFRNMGAPQTPVPIQAAATVTWSDEDHVRKSRKLYQDKWAMVAEMLGDLLEEPTPDAGFFLWLKLPGGLNGVETAQTLWRELALKTIPGSYIEYPDHGSSKADNRLRLALVDDLPTTQEALRRLRAFLEAHIVSTNSSHVAQRGH